MKPARKLFDMPPCFARQNSENIPFCNSEHLRDCLDFDPPISAHLTDGDHIFCREFGIAVFGTTFQFFGMRNRSVRGPGCLPSLIAFVGDVHSLRSKKQMRRIAAWCIIATVQNKKAAWNRTVDHQVSDSVSVQDSSGNKELPVSEALLSCLPRPAFVRPSTINLPPKTGGSLFSEIDSFNRERYCIFSIVHGNYMFGVRAVLVLNTLRRLASFTAGTGSRQPDFPVRTAIRSK